MNILLTYFLTILKVQSAMGIPPIKFELKILKNLIVNPKSYVSAIAVFQWQLIAGRAHLMHPRANSK